jgi:hypothetical protein
VAQKLGQDEFIRRAIEIHGKKYGYGAVRYRNVDSKVKIKCSIHGWFYQTPWVHIGRAKSGCPKCGDLRSAEKRRKRRADSFVRDSQRIHGKRYDYSKSKYVSNNRPICIICKKHGEFWPTPDNHIRLKCRCPKCSKIEMAVKVVSNYGKELISKLRKVHGNKYGYDKVRYVGASNTIKIRCRRHGYFNQITSVHLAGGGCKLCAVDKLKVLFSLSHKEFVSRARKLHGRKYSYLGKYRNSQTPYKIRCPIHSYFYQAPASHLNGSGCSKCSNKNAGEAKRMGHLEFVKKAKKLHPKYTFPERYKTSMAKLGIRCPKHGVFIMRPNTLLRGHGCQECDSEKSAERIRLTHEEFLQRCWRVHKDKYRYPQKYKGGQVEIKILCPKHGNFFQKPSNHLVGSGCPVCFDSSGERRVSRILEKMRISFVRQKKFPDLQHKRPLRFDFWLPRLKTLIEYDGVQHFQASTFFGGERAFEETQVRDRIKTTWARRMKLPLIRIPYTHPMPEQILARKLKS